MLNAVMSYKYITAMPYVILGYLHLFLYLYY